MKKYIFGKRDSIHIIDLTQTLELINVALEKIFETIKNNGKVLFISTKKQASEAISDLAKDKDADYKRQVLELQRFYKKYVIEMKVKLADWKRKNT